MLTFIEAAFGDGPTVSLARELVAPNRVAKILGISLSTLARMRSPNWRPGHPRLKFVRVGPRAVRYRLGDLDQYLLDCAARWP